MYDVGQIVYVIAQRKVIPVQIAEQVVRRTLDGTTVEYRVSTGKGSKNLFDLDDVGSVHFDSIQSVRDYMLEGATKSINDMLQAAEDELTNRFDTSPRLAPRDNSDYLESA